MRIIWLYDDDDVWSDVIHVQRQKRKKKIIKKPSTNQYKTKQNRGLTLNIFSPESSKITDYHSSWMEKKMKEKIGSHAYKLI